MKLHPPPRKTKIRKREIEIGIETRNRSVGEKGRSFFAKRVTQIRGIGVQFEFPR